MKRLFPWYRNDFLAASAVEEGGIGTPECGVRAIMGVFGMMGVPQSLLDLGCGVWGSIPTFAAYLGVDSIGVDIAVSEKGVIKKNLSLQHIDLNKPYDAGRQFDLVTCWEVGEHLEESSADTFADTLARHTSNLLIFTAAIPGQGGDGHINCQTQEYWRDRLETRGLSYLPQVTERLSCVWGFGAGPCTWYPDNVQVFRRLSDADFDNSE